MSYTSPLTRAVTTAERSSTVACCALCPDDELLLGVARALLLEPRADELLEPYEDELLGVTREVVELLTGHKHTTQVRLLDDNLIFLLQEGTEDGKERFPLAFGFRGA